MINCKEFGYRPVCWQYDPIQCLSESVNQIEKEHERGHFQIFKP